VNQSDKETCSKEDKLISGALHNSLLLPPFLSLRPHASEVVTNVAAHSWSITLVMPKIRQPDLDEPHPELKGCVILNTVS